MSETLDPAHGSGDAAQLVGAVGHRIERPDALDEYEIVEPAIAGGEGWTYRCHNLNGDTRAVKQLRPPALAGRVWPSEADLRRWHDVNEPLRLATTPHLVRVVEVFAGGPPRPLGTRADTTSPRCAYIVMEWVEGPTLDELVRGDECDLRAIASHIRDLVAAVRTLHSPTEMNGSASLHLDIKPSNCVVAPERGLVLVDTGTMRRLGEGPDRRRARTPGYAAPEYLDDPDREPTPAADHYSVGAVLYFCLTNENPPTGPAEIALATMRRTMQRTRPGRLPRRREVTAAVLSMLDPDPASRAPDLHSWARRVASLLGLDPRPRTRRRRRVAVVGAATAAAVFVAVGLLALPRTMSPVDPSSSAGSNTADFVPFGATHAAFAARQDGTTLDIAPPSGPNRYDYLWGMYAEPGPSGCSNSIEFDVSTRSVDRANGFGVAVVPRGRIRSDQPAGSSVQYEWVPGYVTGGPGPRIRPALLPGGAWDGRSEPVAAPDPGTRRHIVVDSVGRSISMSVDGVSARYETPTVECGGVAIRVWGARAVLENVRLEQS